MERRVDVEFFLHARVVPLECGQRVLGCVALFGGPGFIRVIRISRVIRVIRVTSHFSIGHARSCGRRFWKGLGPG